MSGDDFQTRYATVMDSMLKSAIAETTKLFETMVDELKEEISKMKKENEDLKSKCDEYENAQNPKHIKMKRGDPGPGLSSVSDKRDTAVQCDLVPLGAVLVDKCDQFRDWAVQSQEQQGQHGEMQEELQKNQQCQNDGEDNSERAFILIKQKESDDDDCFPSCVFKQEDEEPTLDHSQVPSEIPGSPGTPEGSPIYQHSSYKELTFLQKDKETLVAVETLCLARENGLSCLGEAQTQGSEPEHPVLTLSTAEDDREEQFGVDQHITETSTQTEVKTFEKQPFISAQQQSVVPISNKDLPSDIKMGVQDESETLVNEQFRLVLEEYADVSTASEQVSEEVSEAHLNPPARRRRGRPPKRPKLRNSQKQAVVVKVLSSSVDIPTDQEGANSHSAVTEKVGVPYDPHRRGQTREKPKPSTSQLPVQEMASSPPINITSVQEEVNTPSSKVQKMEVSSLSASTASSSKGCASKKAKPKSRQVPMENEEEAISSPSSQVPPANETVGQSPKVPSVRRRERHTSCATLQDAMLLVEAMNAQTSAYDSTKENVLSPQTEMENTPKTEHSPSLVTLPTAAIAADELTTPLFPQTSTATPIPQLLTVPPQASFSLPTGEQSPVATIKAIVIPKQQYAVTPPKTVASPIPPSTVATEASVQSLQQRPLHPLITVVAPNKQLNNSAPQKIIVVPRPISSFTPHTIAALSPTQLSTVVSTVVAAQKNSLPPASTAAGLPLGAASLPTVPLKTIVVTPGQPLSPVTSQTTATSTEQQSATLPPQKITIVVPRQVPAVVPRQQPSNVGAQTVVVTKKQQAAESPLNVSVSSAQSVSLSQQLNVTDVPAAPFESAITLSQKWDSIQDDMEAPQTTATVSTMTTLSTETSLNLKKSVSSGIVQTSVPPKILPVFQEKLSAVVKLTKLPLTASTKEMATVMEMSALSAETLCNLKDSFTPRPEPDTGQEKLSAAVKSTHQQSPAVSKELIKSAKMPTLSTEIPSSLKDLPASPAQASALSTKTIAVALSMAKLSQSVSSASVREDAPENQIATSSYEICSSLKEAPVTGCRQLSVPSNAPSVVLEKSAETINKTRSSPETIAEKATHVQTCVSPNRPPIKQEKPSSGPLRLTSIISKDTASDPHLQMTKAQFLAQLAVSPIFQQKVLCSDPVDTSTVHTETSTGKLKGSQKESLVSRLRSHLRTRLQASKTKPKTESVTEPESTPVSIKKPLAKDSATHRKTNSECIAVSPKKPGLDKDLTEPEKKTNSPTSVSPRRCRLSKDDNSPKKTEPTSVSPKSPKLSKDGTSPTKTGSEPASVSPKKPRISKDGASPKKTGNEPACVSLKRPRLSKDGADPKQTVSEPASVSLKRPRLSVSKETSSERSSLSRRCPRLAKDGASPKMIGESTGAQKPIIIQDVTSPKKRIRMANGKKLTKSPKADILVKMENSSQLELQNGAEPSHVAETYASHGALKKAKAKAVWTPPKMSTNKPLTRGKTVPLSPSKRDKRSQNQPQLTTTPQRRSQGTSSRMMTPPNQLFYMLPSNSQTVKPKSKGRPPLSRTVIFPPSVSLHPIPVKAPPIVSPLQPLSVIGRRLLKNQCGECGRVLSSAAALESHVSLHTGRRPFSCTLCGKSFPDSKGLTRHGRVHRNGRIHVCSKCGKGFVYRFGLTKHLQMVHGRVKPFICQICDKGFFTKRDVEAHIRVHTGEKPFHCNLCEKQFKRRVELNVHLRWHNGEKRHWCPYCGKGFLDYNNMKRHKYIHTGEKPHSCPHCSKKFTQSGHLKKHMKNVHKIK